MALSSSTWLWALATSTTIDTIWVLTDSRFALMAVRLCLVLAILPDSAAWLAARLFDLGLLPGDQLLERRCRA